MGPNKIGLAQRQQLNIVQQSTFPFCSGSFVAQATALVESAKIEVLGNDTKAILKILLFNL